MVLALVALGCGAGKGTCGDGTHLEDGVCVADEVDADSDADTDADSDSDADSDADTDTDSDTDSDTDTPHCWKGDFYVTDPISIAKLSMRR